jgi:type IX secretion system PorP/SprF family membrane protein
MKAQALYILLFFHVCKVHSQQFPQYTQFLFNKIGYSPASSGTSLNAPMELIFGGRTQWRAFERNPRSQFVSFNYNFVPERSYKGWHNVGAYVDQDENGYFTKNDIWLSYTYHLFVTRRLVLSMGVFAGMKQFKASIAGFDRADPVIQKSSSIVLAYPDIVPGIRIASKRSFADFSLQQISMFSQRGIGGAIGSPSKLFPHYNLSFGRKAPINDYNMLVLAMNVRGSFIGIPSVEFNAMNFYNKRFGYGASIRGRDFLCAIFQVRLVPNLNIGLAYDLSINRMIGYAPHTFEVMIGLSPVFNGEATEKTIHRCVDDCTF